jgi:hypothetical protein
MYTNFITRDRRKIVSRIEFFRIFQNYRSHQRNNHYRIFERVQIAVKRQRKRRILAPRTHEIQRSNKRETVPTNKWQRPFQIDRLHRFVYTFSLGECSHNSLNRIRTDSCVHFENFWRYIILRVNGRYSGNEECCETIFSHRMRAKLNFRFGTVVGDLSEGVAQTTHLPGDRMTKHLGVPATASTSESEIGLRNWLAKITFFSLQCKH